MAEQNGTNLTQEYEQEALKAFRLWYRQNQPTINEIPAQVGIIAQACVHPLTLFRITRLVAENPDWCRAPVMIEPDDKSLSMCEVARRLLISHLTHVIEREGMQSVYSSMPV